MSDAGPQWWPAYVGIGSNLDSPLKHVQSARQDLGQIPRSLLFASSSLYRSAPMGGPDQPDYINAACAMLTQLPADDFLRELQRIEDFHGRLRSAEKWGPRTLDLDLLVFGALTRNSDTLTLPHPGIASRIFVLLPLSDVAPHLWVPGLGSVARLLSELGPELPGIEKLPSNDDRN